MPRFHEADEGTSSNAGGGNGSIHWVELWSKDIEADLDWLKGTFGYSTEKMAMPTGDYHILKSGDATAGGAMASPNPNAPAMWLTWVQVDDVDTTVAKANRHGGSCHMEPNDVPGVGRMAVLADPAGVVFGVITPAPSA